MSRTSKVLLGYILSIFLLVSLSVFFSPWGANLYLTIAIFVMGMGAIVCQKRFHRQKFVDMGFRLSRNVLVGLGVAIVFTGVVVLYYYWLPSRMGIIQIVANEDSVVDLDIVPPWLAASLIGVLGGAILFIACLFGEELAFRGYLLPKLEELFGGIRAVVICSIIFGLWHLPAYFSIYSGGAAEQGWTSVAQMLIAHGISSVPVCILYLTTRELYGVSVFHSLVDILQYGIVGNPAMGDASKDALYNMVVLDERLYSVVDWSGYLLGVGVMLILCVLGRKLTLRRPAQAGSAQLA